MQHNRFVTKGRKWGTFLEVKANAAELYRKQYERERRWARENVGKFGVFLSSSTDPYLPQEKSARVTRSILEAMCELPTDLLIVQTRSLLAARDLDLFVRLKEICELRVQVTIESDRESIDGLPKAASSVEGRFELVQDLKSAGVKVMVTVSPLLPIKEPVAFFKRIAEVADGVIIDHYIDGDGSKNGQRTKGTKLPEVLQKIDKRSTSLDYREEMVELAQTIMPGRVGVSIEGFAGERI